MRKGEEELLNIVPSFSLRDLLQVMIGATILAVPVGLTEETWGLGNNLPIINTVLIIALSIFFITSFTYYHYHHKRLLENGHPYIFLKRVFFTYVLSFLIVGVILTLIQVAPWTSEFMVAFKRVAIVTLPASMSAAIADRIR